MLDHYTIDVIKVAEHFHAAYRKNWGNTPFAKSPLYKEIIARQEKRIADLKKGDHSC